MGESTAEVEGTYPAGSLPAGRVVFGAALDVTAGGTRQRDWLTGLGGWDLFFARAGNRVTDRRSREVVV